MYVADRGNNAVRKVTISTGIISTIAGANDQGFSGDGGYATSAMLNEPVGIAVDLSGMKMKKLIVNIKITVPGHRRCVHR